MISSPWIGDLGATLTSPQGTSVQLFDGPGIPASQYGCSGDDIDVSFDDAAVLSSTDFENMCNNAPAISGTFQPMAVLSAFNGENVVGNWTLTILDSYTASDDGTLDGWGLNICLTPVITGINQNETNNTVSIYPNPTSNIVTIDLNSIDNIENITLMDVQGKIVYQNKTINQSKIKIDLNNNSEGIYILKVQYANAIKTYKVIKK